VTLSFTPDENNSSTHIEWDEEAGAYTVETADGVINIRVNPDEKFSKITTDGNILSFLNGEGKEVTYTIGTDFDSMEKSVNEAGQLIYSLIKDGEVIDSIVDVSSAEEALLDMWSTIANIEIVIDITY
jgi:DNA-binding beta-propeller fold protein YncE